MTENDLPAVQTPDTLIVSPLGSLADASRSEDGSARAEEEQPDPEPGPAMPVTKVQPFLQGEDEQHTSHRDKPALCSTTTGSPPNIRTSSYSHVN